MAVAKKKSDSRGRVRTHREKMRAQGKRLVQIWVPDTRSEAFLKEARRQSALLAASPSEVEDQAFIDAVSELKFD
jgi:hypothetical protein